MKQEDPDTNVVEQASTPKFSKLDDIVTLLRLLELLFDDILVDMPHNTFERILWNLYPCDNKQLNK